MDAPPPRRGTAAAVADVYDDLAPDIAGAAHDVAAHYGVRYDDARADANLYFLEAYHTHDPAESELGQRVVFVVRRRLVDAIRLGARRNALLRRQGLDVATAGPAPAEPEPLALGRLSARVGPDARAVLALLIESPPELDDAIRADAAPGPTSVRRHLRDYAVRVWGWTGPRFRAAAAEISQAL